MLYLALLLLIIIDPTSFSLSTLNQDNWQNLDPDVQSRLESVVSEKLSQMFWDLHENCKKDQKLFMKLFILNVNSTNRFNKRTLWDRKSASCFVSVFEVSDEVLKSWCADKPDRMVTFPYEYSEKIKKLSGSKTGTYETLVQANCLFFQSEDDYPRLPLPWIFNFRLDHARKILIYSVLVLAVLGLFTCFYCQCRPVYQFLKGLWIVYRDRRDWNAINEIIKFRDQRIKEEHERRQKTVQTTAL